ncbi:ROK family protein [Halocynthiibacter namhaensis]|uniref:glucokinase n=1 Tax=Halocynthiibacter namhaensis TaxID=1290553 RepID=UPI00068E60E0|nr:ROK family protein [Halocynthiibacter namhaensis]
MWNLVADVGGTNMRLAAIAPSGEIIAQHRFPSTGKLGVADACAVFMAQQSGSPAGVAVAAAGVVSDGAVKLTNAGQKVTCSDLAAACGTANVHILNDFEGAAWSLATVTADDVDALQGRFVKSDAPMLIIGPGTGLGVGMMAHSNGTPNVISGEGGHVRLAPETQDEFDYFTQLIALWPEIQIGTGVAVEAEAILSGTGLPYLYRSIAQVRDLPMICNTAQDILQHGRADTDPIAKIATDLFCRCLGALAGDFALTVDARGGVFITGGVALPNPWLFGDVFMEAFNAGGRHSGWRSKMPVFLYKNDEFGLMGARNFLKAHDLMVQGGMQE